MRSRTVSAEWLLGEPMFFPRPCHPFPFGGTKALFSGAFWLRLVSGMVFSEDFWKAKNITFQLSRVYQLLPWKSEWNILLLHPPSFNFKVIDRRIWKHPIFIGWCQGDVNHSSCVSSLARLTIYGSLSSKLHGSPSAIIPFQKIPWFRKQSVKWTFISSSILLFWNLTWRRI